MIRCVICMRSVEEDRVMMMSYPGCPPACHEHMLEVIHTSDCKQPTEAEWQDFTRRLIHELEDLVTSSDSSEVGK